MPHRILQRDAMRINASGRKQLRLAVAKGQTWSFEASGHWVDGWIWCGPDGYTNPLANMLGYMPQVAQAKWFCLVGQYVDDPSSAFVVGSHCRRSFSRDGEIVFFPNDMRAMRWNNFGAIELLATLMANGWRMTNRMRRLSRKIRRCFKCFMTSWPGSALPLPWCWAYAP